MKSIGLWVIVSLFLCGIVSAERTVWYVHPDSALNTIQAGLDSCADNDIVLVGPGTYYENIVWPNTQGMHLISELGPEQTIIDGDSAGRVITIAHNVDSTTIIGGFAIQNGWDSLCGGGIYCDSSSPVIIGNIIRQNIALSFMLGGYGGGIYCNTSAPIIRCNTIANNRAMVGGGISCNSSSSPIITGNTIIENTAAGLAAYGGGISCSYSSAIIDSNIISNNIATAGSDAYGDGIFCFSSQVTISNNLISDNSSEGIYCWSSHLATIKGNTISNHDRCGIYIIYTDSAHLSHNIITGNGVADGAGIHCIQHSTPIIDSCTISYNIGDGIYCHYSTEPTINYCNIFNNTNYGIRNLAAIWINAENNWWGDATGPYHPTLNPGGVGDRVSDDVDFEPWLSWPVGVEEQPIVESVVEKARFTATIFRGSLLLPEGKKYRVFDITGRVVEPDKIQPGIYFIEIDDKIVQKVIKIW